MLKRHQESKHEGVVDSCKQCNSKFRQQTQEEKKNSLNTKESSIRVMNVTISQHHREILKTIKDLNMKVWYTHVTSVIVNSFPSCI